MRAFRSGHIRPRQRYRTVDVDGTQIRVRRTRPPLAGTCAPTLVLVHGIGMSHRSFGRLARELRDTYRVIAVDLPGFGGAPRPGRSLGIEGHAAAVAAALDALGVDACVVVGHSMGTQVAVELACTRPDLVEAVVLIGPVIDDRRPSLRRQVATLMLDTLEERPGVNIIAATDYLRSFPQVIRELRPMLRHPTLARVFALTVPVLVMRGDHDPIVRHDWAARVTAVAASGTLFEPAGTHHVQALAPDVVAAAISDLLRGVRR